MSFDWINYLCCILEMLFLLMIWRAIDTHPFEKWNYLFTLVLLGGFSVVVTLIDSVFFSIIPFNYAMIGLCFWLGFRRGFKETVIHSLCCYLILLFLEVIGSAILPEQMFMTNAGNLTVNVTDLVLATVGLILARRFRFQEIFRRNKGTMTVFVLALSVPQIALTQAFAAYKYTPPSSAVSAVVVLLQALYTTLVLLIFAVNSRRGERRKLADTEKYIGEMNSHLEESRRSMHDFNKHLRYLRNTVAEGSRDPALIRRVDEYCEPILGAYEKEELLLQLDDPVLRAILYGRRSQAVAAHIDYILDAAPVLPRFPLKSYQIVEVFDNLINNAFECVTELPEENRWIRITLAATPQPGGGTAEHTLSVENPAPSVDMAAVVGERNYSSKGAGHQGVGLRRVSQIVSGSGGSLTVNYQNGVFKVKVTYIL